MTLLGPAPSLLGQSADELERAKQHAATAQVALANGDRKVARAQIEQAIALAPRNAGLHLNLGLIVAGEDPDRADEAFREAEDIGLPPSQADALRKGRAEVEYAMEKRQERRQAAREESRQKARSEAEAWFEKASTAGDSAQAWCGTWESKGGQSQLLGSGRTSRLSGTLEWSVTASLDPWGLSLRGTIVSTMSPTRLEGTVSTPSGTYKAELTAPGKANFTHMNLNGTYIIWFTWKRKTACSQDEIAAFEARALYHAASWFLDGGEEAHAAKLVAAARRRYAGPPWWMTLLEVRARQKHDWPGSEALLRELITTLPEDEALAQALNSLAWGQLEQGGPLTEAIEHARRSVRMAPTAANLDTLGWALFRADHREEATSHLRAALAKDDKDPEIHEHLGDSLFAQGQAREAVRAWARALALDDNLLLDYRAVRKKMAEAWARRDDQRR